MNRERRQGGRSLLQNDIFSCKQSKAASDSSPWAQAKLKYPPTRNDCLFKKILMGENPVTKSLFANCLGGVGKHDS